MFISCLCVWSCVCVAVKSRRRNILVSSGRVKYIRLTLTRGEVKILDTKQDYENTSSKAPPPKTLDGTICKTSAVSSCRPNPTNQATITTAVHHTHVTLVSLSAAAELPCIDLTSI